MLNKLEISSPILRLTTWEGDTTTIRGEKGLDKGLDPLVGVATTPVTKRSSKELPNPSQQMFMTRTKSPVTIAPTKETGRRTHTKQSLPIHHNALAQNTSVELTLLSH